MVVLLRRAVAFQEVQHRLDPRSHQESLQGWSGQLDEELRDEDLALKQDHHLMREHPGEEGVQLVHLDQ